MDDPIRAFLAVVVPDDVRCRVEAIVRPLRARLPDARFVPADALHLTLHFFEAIAPGEVEAVRAAAAAGTVQVVPFDVRLAGLGVFPDDRPPRVLWVGVQDGAAGLSAAAASIGDGLRQRGLPVETRLFRPHLTVARFKDPRPRGVGEAMAAAGPAEAGTFRASSVTLFRSELRSTGAVHTPIGVFPLGGAQGSPGR